MAASLLALPLGLLIGIALGALGGGGSILTVPALVYAIGESPSHATTASLVIVGFTALTGAAGHARAGRVRWGPGVVFGVVGVGGSLLGSRLNKLVNPNVLLLAFAGLMLVAAVAMTQRQRSMQPEAARRPGEGQAAQRLTPRLLLAVAVAGTVVGFMTGFFGVGGGFVIVPALVLALGFGMGDAVGTSLLVIAINTVAALGARAAAAATIEWSVVVPFTLAAMLGSLLGNRIAGRVPAATLTRAFAALLVLLAVYVATRSVLALA
jgi:uncharacterized membrane protein YfcA